MTTMAKSATGQEVASAMVAKAASEEAIGAVVAPKKTVGATAEAVVAASMKLTRAEVAGAVAVEAVEAVA